MKVFKLILKVVGVLLALLFLLIAGLHIYASFDKEDHFYINGAELLDPYYYASIKKEVSKGLDSFGYSRDKPPVYAHRLKSGNGAIIGYRWYSNGDVNTFDDESYEKVTIWIKDLKTIEEGNFKIGENVQVISIRGGSAWPTDACAGEISSGQVSLRKLGDDIEVRIAGKFGPLSIRKIEGYCEKHDFAKSFLAKKVEFTELSSWQGKPGKHPYDETYR